VNRSLALIASFLIAAPAFAQWPNSPPPKTETKPEASQPPPPAKRARDTGPRVDDGSGFGFGVRAAWAWPMGGLTSSEEVSSVVNGALPLWLEAGYHINKSIYAGLYFQYARGFTNCLGGQDCSSSGLRFGAEVLYNFAPDATLQPWAGIGGGYELFNSSRTGDERTFKGLELLNLQAGLNWALTKNFSLGPFASYQLLGKFTSFSANGVSNDISDTTGHNWLQVGIKAGFRL
jgi:Opacity family porin protein